MFFHVVGLFDRQRIRYGALCGPPDQASRISTATALLRILPVYRATLTIFSLIFIPTIFRFQNLPAFINMLAFNADGQLPYMPISALWSISTEMQFYLAAPLIFILLSTLTARSRLAIALALTLTILSIVYRVHVFYPFWAADMGHRGLRAVFHQPGLVPRWHGHQPRRLFPAIEWRHAQRRIARRGAGAGMSLYRQYVSTRFYRAGSHRCHRDLFRWTGADALRLTYIIRHLLF